jgi:large subunit ribosomal protein L18Ae
MVRPFLKHYQVVGREQPTEKVQNPTVYKYEVFAPNYVVAKSRFWKLMNDKNGIKSTKGDILSVKVVKDKKIAARNYSVSVVYYSQKCGYTTMVKEVRDVSKSGAVCQAYNDMAARHRARYANIEILSVKSIADSECRRAYVKQFHNAKLAFPQLQKRAKTIAKKDRVIFQAKNSKKSIK